MSASMTYEGQGLQGLTNDQRRQIHDVPANGETEGTRHWCARWLEQDAVRVNRLCRVFESMVRKVLPVFHNGLVFK